MLLRLVLKVCGEPFNWGIHARDLPTFLNTQGWSLRHLSGPPEFTACAANVGFDMPERAFVGEYLAEAHARIGH